MKTVVHIISHSHWDREWYMAFEQHRLKLVELIDATMELFDNDASFRSFHLDGQTIMLDDYLEIKPENRERIIEFVKAGRFLAGPWYVLQDEFLTSGEANVRNLLIGDKEAKEYGGNCKIGYFPDAFGNAGQMPQLLKQAGMKAVVFGRGVKPVGFNNQTLEGGEYESAYSEMNWESPDGSSLLGILFANWYNNGMEIPTDKERAKVYWDAKLADARRFAGTRHLLLMNGCDHQPVQKDLSAAIATARELYPDVEFIHSDFGTYVEAVSAELQDNISTIKGELTSQETDGLYTLVNTCSSHVDLKIMNRTCEVALEKEAEPMAVLASLLGKSYPKEQLRYSWKMLMQNHPHDSICGCSVDEVNDEMKIRFDKSRQVAKALFGESMSYLVEKIDTARFVNGEPGKVLPIAVFNTTGWNRTGVVSVVVDYERCYERGLVEAHQRLEQLELPKLVLKNEQGCAVEADFEDMGVHFGYDLPEDKFRQTYMARQIRVTFEAEDVPPMGYRTYYVAEETGEVSGNQAVSLVSDERTMENQFLKVEISEDGSYTLTEKKTGRIYERIGFYEETGDIGNEYIFVQDSDKKVVSTKGTKATITLVEDKPYRAIYRIEHIMEVPEDADESLEYERQQFKNIHQRRAGRSRKMVSMPVTTMLTLERGAKGVKVDTIIENTAKDHRIRVMIPTALDTNRHLADSMFEVAERNNRHSRVWKNPSACEHQQNFVAMKDATAGILVANFGLYEYEVLPGRDNMIAVTLLRATGEMGDWGVFPTPAAQMQGTYTLRYEIIPFAAEELTMAYQEGYQFQVALTTCGMGVQKGTLPLTESFLAWNGEGLNLTGFKKQEEGEDIMLRFVNNTGNLVMLTIPRKSWMHNAYRSNVLEENLGALDEDARNEFIMVVKPCEIVTVGIAVR